MGVLGPGSGDHGPLVDGTLGWECGGRYENTHFVWLSKTQEEHSSARLRELCELRHVHGQAGHGGSRSGAVGCRPGRTGGETQQGVKTFEPTFQAFRI